MNSFSKLNALAIVEVSFLRAAVYCEKLRRRKQSANRKFIIALISNLGPVEIEIPRYDLLINFVKMLLIYSCGKAVQRSYHLTENSAILIPHSPEFDTISSTLKANIK